MYSGELKQMVEILVKAVNHKGFALVDVLQPCVSWNRVNTYRFYRERVYKLEEEGHDISDWNNAFQKALEWGDRIPIGVFYTEERPDFAENFPALKDGPLVEHSLNPDVTKILEEFS